MFDTAKVQRMTTELEKFSHEHDNVYVIMEVLNADAFALFRRLKVRLRAILSDVPLYNGNKVIEKILGLPVLKTEEAAENFNESTGLILFTKKPVPFIQTTFDFAINDKLLKIPAFVLANDESLAIYDRLTLMMVLYQYQKDGLNLPMLQSLAYRFARGLTTFLDPRCQYFKFQLWDRRECFQPRYDFDDTAIVIQGPIAYANNYTVETFKFYRSIYPNAPIVVSTWKGEATDAFRLACRKNSVVLIESDLPDSPGRAHVNYQLKSSFTGVKYVQENTSAKFVLKTRTDQRINRCDFLLYFKNLSETFPPSDDKLRQRIIFGNSFKSRSMPFFFQDFFSFGHVVDLVKLYGIPYYSAPGDMTYLYKNRRRYDKLHGMLSSNLCPLDYDSGMKNSRKFVNLNKIMRRFCNVEMYIVREFYKRHIAPLDENRLLETCWKFTRDYLILVDWGSIFFEWPKQEDARRYEVFPYTGWTLNFARWFDMYRNFKDD